MIIIVSRILNFHLFGSNLVFQFFSFFKSFILIFISGQMWNQIRGPPLVHRNPQTGQIGFFAGGHGYQFIAETYIVFSIYGLIVLGIILMNEAPKYQNDSGMKKGM